jgi:hypothetical protein
MGSTRCGAIPPARGREQGQDGQDGQGGCTDRETDRQTRETDRQKNRETDRPTEKADRPTSESEQTGERIGIGKSTS